MDVATCPAAQVSTPRIPVISNVDAAAHSDPAVIKSILTKQASQARHAATRAISLARRWPWHPPAGSSARQVTAPVQWETIMKGLIAGGMETGYELGPGKVLAGIMKRIDKKATVVNVEV